MQHQRQGRFWGRGVILAPVTHFIQLPTCPCQGRAAGKQQQGQAPPPVPLSKHTCYSLARPQALLPLLAPVWRGELCLLTVPDTGMLTQWLHCPATQVPGNRFPRQRPPRPPCTSGRQLRKEKSIYILASETAAHFTPLVCLVTCAT